jgi:ArsR family transcriptional regulator
MDFERQIDLIKSDFEKSRRLLVALGDETRQSIIITLMGAECDGMRVGEITAKTHLSRPAVSHHMKILLDTGLANVWHEGTMNFYTGNFGAEFQHLCNLVYHIEEFRAAVIEAFGSDSCFSNK